MIFLAGFATYIVSNFTSRLSSLATDITLSYRKIILRYFHITVIKPVAYFRHTSVWLTYFTTLKIQQHLVIYIFKKSIKPTCTLCKNHECH
jgi:hypothetical protein